jgi:hypothetical protein
VDTGQRPQNFIRDTGLADRFEEYPKLKELIRLKVRILDDDDDGLQFHIELFFFRRMN